MWIPRINIFDVPLGWQLYSGNKHHHHSPHWKLLYSAGDHVHSGESYFKKGVELLERVLTGAMKIVRGLENRSLKGDTKVFKQKRATTKQKGTISSLYSHWKGQEIIGKKSQQRNVRERGFF